MRFRMPKPERKIEKLTEDEKERVKDKIPPTMREMKEENELNSLAVMDLAGFTLGGEGGE